MTEQNIKGLDQLLKNLTLLPEKLKAEAFVFGTRAAANEIAREARKLVPHGRGISTEKTKLRSKKKRIHLRDTIRVKKAYIGKGKIVYVVHAGRGIAHAHMVEFGTAPHLIKARKSLRLKVGSEYFRQVRHPGAKARPFMRPALDSKSSSAVEKFKKSTQRRINKMRFKL